MRYVAYVRISSDDQVGNFSLDAQENAIQQWVANQEGILVETYIDEAYSGRTTDRPAFLQMRRDARKAKFDAIVVYRFDRLARTVSDALAIKYLLRHEYGLKVFSVTEASEDSDGEMGIIIEGVMESIADWYSQNLSEETSRGKKERARQGYHNNRAPFGMDKDGEGILIPDGNELAGLQMIFEMYSTGDVSYNDIARKLNDSGYRTKRDKRFSTDAIRDIVRNRTYLGYVKYQPYIKNPDGSRSYKGEIQWFEGKHDAVISEDLFNLCQDVRASRRSRGDNIPRQERIYLLSNLLYCAECAENPIVQGIDSWCGKMRAESATRGAYYRCRSRDFGLECSQKSIEASKAEAQVIEALKIFSPPAGWHEKLIANTEQLLEDRALDQQIADIKTMIKRMDFRWDEGFFLDKEEFLQKRRILQRMLTGIHPDTTLENEIEQANEIWKDFPGYWDSLDGDKKARKSLLRLLLSKVLIKDNDVLAIILRPDYHIKLP